MNILFWSIIGLMTVAAWGCIALPFYKNSAIPVSRCAKVGFITFPLFAVGLYLVFGGSAELQKFWAWQQQKLEVQQAMAKLKSPQELIDHLRDHLSQNPQSAEGWYLLGKLYLDQRQYADAESALNQAHQLQPQSSETVLALAKANFFNHQGHLTPAMAALLTSVLKSLPEPVDALNLLAVNAYRQKDFRQAVSLWQQALSLVPPDSPDSRTLLGMINQAQHQASAKE